MKTTKQLRVAITGIGMISPLGHDMPSTWDALLQKRSGVSPIQLFDASGFPVHIAAEVKKFKPRELIKNKKLLKFSTRPTQFALIAAEEALNDAGIRPTQQTNQRWGLVTGSSMMASEFSYWMDFHEEFAKQGELDVRKLGQLGLSHSPPSEFGKVQSNTAVGLIAQEYQILGYSMSVHTACASGGQALGLGLQAIRRGDADYILAGGYDSMINPTGISGFCLLGALSTSNEHPETASRPFDRLRNGFVLGEGAAFLVLEVWEKAIARGAKIYAELAGEGNTLSGYRITDSHPSGDGAIQSIKAAMQDADITPAQIDYINAHGTATQMNDLCESNAFKAVFGADAKKLSISSTKSQVGHLISAAGALEGAFCALAIHHGKMPMTLNLQNPDPDCDLDFITEGPRTKELRAVLSNSFGFGGTNNCLAFKNSAYVNEVNK